MPLWLKYFQNILFKSLDSGNFTILPSPMTQKFKNIKKKIISVLVHLPLYCTGKEEVEKSNLQRFYCTFLGSNCEESKQVVIDVMYNSLTSVSCHITENVNLI